MKNILDLLNQSNPAQQTTQPTQQIKQMIGAIKSASNPKAYVENMIQDAVAKKNPGLFKAVEFIKQNGGDAKSACEKLAAENGFSLQDLGL